MKLFENEILYLLGNRVIATPAEPYVYCSECIFREGNMCKLRDFQSYNLNKFLTSFDCLNQNKIYKQLKIN